VIQRMEADSPARESEGAGVGTAAEGREPGQ
jgi:hypothetical protein